MPTKDDCRAHRLQAQCAEVDHNADRLAVSVALLARAATAPGTPSERQVLSPTVLLHAQCRVQKLYMHACMVMPVILDRVTRTASLPASHSLLRLPPHHRQGARCCLRLFCRTLSVCRNCTCKRLWLIAVVVDRMTWTATPSALHSSQGLPAHHRQRARCCLRPFCRTLSVRRNCTCMRLWLMAVMVARMTRTA